MAEGTTPDEPAADSTESASGNPWKTAFWVLLGLIALAAVFGIGLLAGSTLDEEPSEDASTVETSAVEATDGVSVGTTADMPGPESQEAENPQQPSDPQPEPAPDPGPEQEWVELLHDGDIMVGPWKSDFFVAETGTLRVHCSTGSFGGSSWDLEIQAVAGTPETVITLHESETVDYEFQLPPASYRLVMSYSLPHVNEITLEELR